MSICVIEVSVLNQIWFCCDHYVVWLYLFYMTSKKIFLVISSGSVLVSIYDSRTVDRLKGKKQESVTNSTDHEDELLLRNRKHVLRVSIEF